MNKSWESTSGKNIRKDFEWIDRNVIQNILKVSCNTKKEYSKINAVYNSLEFNFSYFNERYKDKKFPFLPKSEKSYKIINFLWFDNFTDHLCLKNK